MGLALLRRLDRVLVPSRYMHEQLLLNGLQAQRLEKMPLFLHANLALLNKPTRMPRVVFAWPHRRKQGGPPVLALLGTVVDIGMEDPGRG